MPAGTSMSIFLCERFHQNSDEETAKMPRIVSITKTNTQFFATIGYRMKTSFDFESNDHSISCMDLYTRRTSPFLEKSLYPVYQNTLSFVFPIE